MKKRTKLILALPLVLVVFVMVVLLAWVGYGIYAACFLLSSMHESMETGQTYMDSITEEDIPRWIARTEMYLKEYPHSGDIPIPDDLEQLGIIRIDVFSDAVLYVWLGGMDHTYLEVRRTAEGSFCFTAHYNDEHSKVIWPNQE